MNSNPTLENQLNAAIAERGYRISPRASLADRLARYIQLKYSANGREVDNEEAQAVAVMMMMKHSTASLEGEIEEPPAKRRRTVRVNDEGDMRVTIGGSHCMTRRSQVARQPSPSPAAASTEGTHSMIRRSQTSQNTLCESSSTNRRTWASNVTSVYTVAKQVNPTITLGDAMNITNNILTNGTHPMVRRSQVARR
jgi:hypothetical protein